MQIVFNEYNENKFPVDYAHKTGNVSIPEEFFANKLAIALKQIFTSDESTELKVTEILDQQMRLFLWTLRN